MKTFPSDEWLTAHFLEVFRDMQLLKKCLAAYAYDDRADGGASARKALELTQPSFEWIHAHAGSVTHPQVRPYRAPRGRIRAVSTED